MKRQMPSALASHLAASVRAARRRYRKRLARCQREFSEVAVHQLRVETRRILALLDLLATLHFPVSPERLVRSFKERLEVFGDLRDTQVQLRALEPMWADFPEARPLKNILKRREEKLVGRLVFRIQETKHARLNRRLKEIEKNLARLPSGGSRAPGGTAVLAALGKKYQQVAALRARVRTEEVETIHRMRVAFKRFRYASELLNPLLPEFDANRLKQMKEYQDAAGSIQDLEVLLARLAQIVKDRKLGPVALRNLRGELSRRKQKAVEAFMARMDDLKHFRPGPARRSKIKAALRK